ncbi:YacP-like NYN domain protein [Aquisphaera giovannonii]|uniref:YacP-like NYN domain protein n=1 Tax=Aquisphaera giovannonii TaxID=406548 RepID=A0A5B9WB50_9BACT|nr:NYN domain-containing protein [Aquisphaera giovannonii]QEH37265.1 YacP-like NYN domain protein [Aquisphaera giovannonii]
MAWLIDGYNLMHAAGAIGGKEVTREAFRRLRRRFLDELADALGPARARETTVVFDANSPPRDFDLETTYKGLRVLFALEDESADARIEMILAAHSVPKSLIVVSSDRRVRRAAARRRAEAVPSDQFLDQLDRMRAEGRRKPDRDGAGEASPAGDDGKRNTPLSAQEAAFWLEAFSDIADDPGLSDGLRESAPMLTDEDIERIRREVDREP